MKEKQFMLILMIGIALMLNIMLFAKNASHLVRYDVPGAILSILVLLFVMMIFGKYDLSYVISKWNYYKKKRKKYRFSPSVSLISGALASLPAEFVVLYGYAKGHVAIEGIVICPTGIHVIKTINKPIVEGKYDSSTMADIAEATDSVKKMGSELQKLHQSVVTSPNDISVVLVNVHASASSSGLVLIQGVPVVSAGNLAACISQRHYSLGAAKLGLAGTTLTEHASFQRLGS